MPDGPAASDVAATDESCRDFAHIGPDTLAGRFIRRFWQPLIPGDELPAGAPKRVQLLGEYFTAYRGEDGVAHVVEDRFPHRLTMLSLGWVEGDCIRCFYHGWMFDPDGNCVDMPAEKDSFRHKVKIRAYPTREYGEIVWAYLIPYHELRGPLPEVPALEFHRVVRLAISVAADPLRRRRIRPSDPTSWPRRVARGRSPPP